MNKYSLLFTLILLVISLSAVYGEDINSTNSVEISTERSSSNIYFNGSVSSDGNGSINNPYKYLSASRLEYNSVAHFANGEYSLDKTKRLVSNITIIGEISENTIIKFHGTAFENEAFYTLTIKNITLSNANIKNIGTINASNTIFRNGSGYKSFGGAIYNYKDSLSYGKVYLDNCTFINNYASCGGAIYGNKTLLNILNSKFINNNASYGGSICNLDTSSLIINSKFINNNGKYYGGAIFHMYGDLNIFNTEFLNNSALNGGGVFTDNLTFFNVSSSKFSFNKALLGVIFSSFNFKFKNLNNTFKNNTGENIYNQTKLTISTNNDYTIFTNNNSFNGTIPSRYNLVEEGYVSSVKDQKAGGNCWAFASIASLESCILKASNKTLDLSEENMKNLAALYSTYGWKVSTNEGGYPDMALGYLISWIGPVNESSDRYCDYSLLSPILNSILHIQNVYYIPTYNKTSIKEAILKYGAVASSLCYDVSHYSSFYCSYYYTGHSKNSNHAVTIVGWDDNYSKTKFKNIPEGNGAFIVKNSWGTNWGDNGYFYVSYYDPVLCKSSYTFILNDSIRYNKNYQYDIAGMTDYFISNQDTIWYEVIFNSRGNDLLTAFSTHFRDITNFTAHVYINNDLKLVQNGTAISGYYTIKLNKILPLKFGDTFKISLKIKTNKDASFPICENITTTRPSYTIGNSFFSYDGNNWFDLGNYEKNTTIGHYISSSLY